MKQNVYVTKECYSQLQLGRHVVNYSKKINEINDLNLFFNMINVFFIDILLIGNLNQSDQIDYKCINSCI